MLNNLLQKFAILSVREKWLIVAALLVVLWGAWDNLIYQRLTQTKQHLQHELTDTQSQINLQQQLAFELEKKIRLPQNGDKQKQLNQLKIQYQQLSAKMLLLNEKFVSPELMIQVLNDLLKQDKQLNLIKLTTLPVTALLEVSEQSQQPVYKHRLILQFSGNYLATLNYLQAIEAMPWHFIWDRIDYQVKNYPQAEITLQIYTLSLKKDWLNV